MATAAVQNYYRPEDLLAMESGHRYELIYGQLVERNMGGISSRIGLNVTRLLENHVTANALGLVFPADCGYQAFRNDPGRVRYPDGSFICHGRLPDNKAPVGHVRIAPDRARIQMPSRRVVLRCLSNVERASPSSCD